VYRQHEGPVANGDQSSERPDRTETFPAIFKKESESKGNDEEYEFPAQGVMLAEFDQAS
jgi:hypothetical protein